MPAYPKRLIEVDLPIRRISAHARREKSIRHGHISTLHIWWARRPLAACRAVICASLWPDPADGNCPEAFIEEAKRQMLGWTPHERLQLLGEESRAHFNAARQKNALFDDPMELRKALLDFIADFANWDNSTKPEFLETSRALTQCAHEALGGVPGTRPLVVDPFAGGGSIPLEALRVGADAFASDLNPIPVLLNKVVLEYIPKYGQRLADEVRKWGAWIKEEAEKELAEFYPKDPDGATPIAYLWARTIQCEGPGCGAEVPLIRSLWLAKKANRSVALQLVPNPKKKRVDFKIITKQKGGWVNQDDPREKIEKPEFEGTVKRGSATCPCCGYTTPVSRVREQLSALRGGADSSTLFCVVTLPFESNRREFRKASEQDLCAFDEAGKKLNELRLDHGEGVVSLIPDEVIPTTELRRISVPIYGMKSWGDLFSSRQALSLVTLTKLTEIAFGRMAKNDDRQAEAVATVLGIAVSRFADICNALCMWETSKTQVRHMYTRQAIGMLWDYAEPNVFSDSAGDFAVTLNTMLDFLERQRSDVDSGQVEQASATLHPLPEDSVDALITDPPYYDAVPYAHLSDFFYVWLRRSLKAIHEELFVADESPKRQEVVVDRPHELSNSTKDIAFYERELTKAFCEGRRILKPNGVATIVFASKTTFSWEAVLQAVVNAGLVISGSWPIDTELATKLAAIGQARLMSSVHLVCRPRENPDGSIRADDIGDWRDVLSELPKRIHEWLPRLAEEGVVGADAIFACLGPALEIFSRYSRVEKASGEQVTLREYLEHVWAAVSREALSTILSDADVSGLEPDARLTAMWLWTLTGGVSGGSDADSAESDEEDSPKKKAAKGGYVLEYDAARKIAQGLGADLASLRGVVEIKGETARLLPVAERTPYLFGKDAKVGEGPKRRKKDQQLDLFSRLTDEATAETAWEEVSVSKPGETVLDRIHQSMILFATGRGEALRRFLVDDGIGRDAAFWKLAQSLSALYPGGSQEKRWVDGVLARKKGLGL